MDGEYFQEDIQMAFCGYCGAELADENAPCGKCGGKEEQTFYQQAPPPPAPWPGPPPKDEMGKIIGMAFLVIFIIVVVVIVLAAVLYVMVIGFSGHGLTTPVGAWNNVEALSPTSVELTYGSFSGQVEPYDLIIYIQEEGAPIGNLMINDDLSAMETQMHWVNGPSGVTATYVDYNYLGNTVNPGDHIIIDGLEPGTEYSFEVYHIPTESTVWMTGADSTITTE